MIKNVVLDIGGVLVDYHQADFYTGKGYSLEMAQKLKEATMGTIYWEQFDIGLMPESWIRAKMAEGHPELAADIEKTLTEQKDIVTRRAESKDWIEGFRKKGYRVLVLSNFSVNALRYCPEAMDFLGENLGGSGKSGDYGVISEGIISCRDHMVKPYPEVFALLLTRYGLVPEETVFIDDTPSNFRSCGNFGIHTVQFRSREQAAAAVDELG